MKFDFIMIYRCCWWVWICEMVYHGVGWYFVES